MYAIDAKKGGKTIKGVSESLLILKLLAGRVSRGR